VLTSPEDLGPQLLKGFKKAALKLEEIFATTGPCRKKEKHLMEGKNNSKAPVSLMRDLSGPLLVLAGALAILLTKEYVSAKLLTGLVLLDYMSTGYISKLPVAVCFIIFMALTAIAAT